MNFQTVELNGQSIRVAVRKGLEGTPPLLVFNGIGASLELLLPFVEALSPHLTVIVFDVPGVGGSSLPLVPYRFSNLTVIISNMLDELGFGQVDVIGLSWGGFLAQQFAHDYPRRCRKLILAATSAGSWGTVPPSSKVLNLMSSPRRYTDVDYAASIAPQIYGGKFRTDKELCAAHAKKMVDDKAANKSACTEQGYYYQLLSVCLWSSYPWIHRLKQPTLVLAGNDDPIIPLSNMEMLARRIPNAKLHVFEDGHLFLLTDFPRVLPIITEFLVAA